MKYLVLMLLLSSLGFAGWKVMGEGPGSGMVLAQSSLFTARRADLKITVTENGYLKAKNSQRLKPEFERQGTITWLIEEGEEVAEGDVLVEFDRGDLEDKVSELQAQLIQYEMELEAGEAELGIQERDNEAMVEKATLALEVANLKLELYEKGEGPNARRLKILAKEKADSVYTRAKERFEQVPQLAAEGFLTAIQEEEERITLREAEINQENATRDLELFSKYTQRMEITQRLTTVKDATRELENANIKAAIKLKQKTAAVSQQRRQVESTRTRLEQLNEELGHMTIRAPQAGLVLYGDPNQLWMHDQIKVGNTVRKGNTIITLPDLRVMQVLIQVHEADIDLVDVDMPVLVTIESHKGLSFPAKITEVSSVASSNSWTDSTNKTFRVEITMDPVEVELRAGVTARAEVQVEELHNVLQVPIHAVHAVGEEHLCFVYRDGEITERKVRIGKHNAHRVEILEGLDEGAAVLLYDPRKTGGVTDAPLDEATPSVTDGMGSAE